MPTASPPLRSARTPQGRGRPQPLRPAVDPADGRAGPGPEAEVPGRGARRAAVRRLQQEALESRPLRRHRAERRHAARQPEHCGEPPSLRRAQPELPRPGPAAPARRDPLALPPRPARRRPRRARTPRRPTAARPTRPTWPTSSTAPSFASCAVPSARIRSSRFRGIPAGRRGDGGQPLIAVLPGDGIGPEVTAAAARLLEAIGDFELPEYVVGGASIDAHGTALTDEVLEACRAADAVLLGAVGGPKWDTTDPDAPRPEQGLLGLRKGLGLFANLRPARPFDGADRGQPAPARRDRRYRPARRPRAHWRHLLRRQGPRGRHRARRLHLLRRGDRADRPRRLRVRAAARRLAAAGRRRSTRRTCSRPRGSGARS